MAGAGTEEPSGVMQPGTPDATGTSSWMVYPAAPTASPIPATPRTSLLAVTAPPQPIAKLPPAQLEPFILAGIHQDRTPGNVLVVLHPVKRYKLPDGLFEGLRQLGFEVIIHETRRDTQESIRAIRDRLLELHRQPLPLDVIVVGGDGTLDHHFLIAAYAAFYPELVVETPGCIDCAGVTPALRHSIPEPYRSGFLLEEPIPAVEPTHENIQTVWILRSRLQPLLRKRVPPSKILRRVERLADDPLLRVALLATLFPGQVRLLPHHFDLAGLAQASQQQTFRGLYPFLRSIVPYPAGTAADNAVFAGVPGWIYALSSKMLHRFRWLHPLARKLGRRARQDFLQYFARGSTVVPARLSVACVEGSWQRLCSHAIGGPASGRFFAGDLTRKAGSLTGYLLRAPKVILSEAFGRTVVEVESFTVDNIRKSFVKGRLAEGLYTNRTFIGGVGAIPTTTPTSFGGESSLVVLSPIVYRGENAVDLEINLRGLFSFLEAIGKGVLARALHLLGLNPGKMAGEGQIFFLQTEYQMAIQEGEEIRIRYTELDGSPCAVPAQISGDPFQATELGIKVLWGPIPLLAARRSLLFESTQRTLNHLRLQQSYRLDRCYIGGIHHFRHTTGISDPAVARERTGLVTPPLYLSSDLRRSQQLLLQEWRQLGTGDFVDTSAPGLALLRRGLFCHNNDQTSHLLLLKESWSTLLVRQVRRTGPDDVYETRSRYKWMLGGFALHHSQTIHHPQAGPPRILVEDHIFQDAEEFQQVALGYFPLVASTPETPVLPLDRALLPEREDPNREPPPVPAEDEEGQGDQEEEELLKREVTQTG